MINNLSVGERRLGARRAGLTAAVLGPAAVAVMAGAGCALPQPRETALQGVVEHEETTLAFEVGGRLRERFAERGAHVAAGAVVARVDPTLQADRRVLREKEAEIADAQVALLDAGTRGAEIRAAVAEADAARAEVKNLSTTVERLESLLASGATTVAARDDAHTRLEVAQAKVRALEARVSALREGPRKEEKRGARLRAEAARSAIDLEKEQEGRYELRAPHGGFVLDVHADAGEVVAAGTPVLTLADRTRPYVEVFVPVKRLEPVRIGCKARIRVDGHAEPFDAAVEQIAPHTEFTPRYIFSERERATLVVRARLRIADPKERLHAGLPAFVELEERCR